MYDARTKAREISAKLISHLTSVQNVELISMALTEARVIGRNEVHDSKDKLSNNSDFGGVDD